MIFFLITLFLEFKTYIIVKVFVGTNVICLLMITVMAMLYDRDQYVQKENNYQVPVNVDISDKH